MIYSYTFLHHTIQEFHENIVFFFEELFRTRQTNVERLVRPDFWPMVQESRVRLLDRMRQIATIYVDEMTPDEQETMEQAFLNNNAIEDLCDCIRQPYQYSRLARAMQTPLKNFFVSLWEDYPLNVLIENRFGTVKNHFDAFVHQDHQKALICPFCGLNPLKPSGGQYRDAYDHFVPKAFYPFSSVNFHNLVPTCHECNSDEKKAIDVPFRSDGSSRPILYPFQIRKDLLPVAVNIDYGRTYDPHYLSTSLTNNPWQVTLSRPGDALEDFTGWDEIYNVKRRYKERINQFETEWWERFKDYYQDHRDVPFAQLKQEWLNLYRRVIARPMGIVEVGYYRFLFSIPNLENLLSQTVR